MRALYKIIHATSRAQMGSPENRILSESLWMLEQGHQIVIIAPENSRLYEKAKDAQITVYPISFKWRNIANDYKKLYSIFKTEQPYVVHAHGFSGSYSTLKAARKAAVTCCILNIHNENQLRNNWHSRKTYNRLSHYVFSGTDQITSSLRHRYKLNELKVITIPDCTPSCIDAGPDAQGNGIQCDSSPNHLNVVRPDEDVRMPEEKAYTVNEMCRDIIRIYRLHLVRTQQTNRPGISPLFGDLTD